MKQPTFDREGDPTDETLEAIRTWPLEDISGLWDFMKAAWNERMSIEVEVSDKFIEFYTGGWSSNGALINALEENRPVWNRLWHEYDDITYKFALSPEIAHEIEEQAKERLPIPFSGALEKRIVKLWKEYKRDYAISSKKDIADGLVIDAADGSYIASFTQIGKEEHIWTSDKPISSHRLIVRFARALEINKYDESGTAFEDFGPFGLDIDLFHSLLRKECLAIAFDDMKPGWNRTVIAYDGEYLRFLGKIYVKRSEWEAKYLPLTDVITHAQEYYSYQPMFVRELGIQVFDEETEKES